MSIFKRMADFARTNLNALLDQLEDKKKLAEQAIMDLEASKKKAKQLLISAQALMKSTKQRIERLQKQVMTAEEQATIFVKENNDDMAKQSLIKKQDLQQQIRQLEEQVSKEEIAIAGLYEGLSTIDEKISEIKSSSATSQSLHYLNKDDAFFTFDRMEEKIDQKEHELEAFKELLKESEKKDAEAKLSASFDQYSDPAALEKELAAIKKKLND